MPHRNARIPEDEHQRFMRTTVLPFCTGVSRLLALMVGPAGLENRRTWKRDGPWLCSCEFNHPDFELRIVCRDKRIRPFLAYIERPWKHSAYLGRLRPDGTVHVFEQGLRMLFNRLLEADVLEAFMAALGDALARYEALDRRAASPGAKAVRSVPRPVAENGEMH